MTLQTLSFFGLSKSLLESYQEKLRLLADYLPPCNQRLQSFIADYFSDLDLSEMTHLPNNTLILDRHGVACTLSLPAKRKYLRIGYTDHGPWRTFGLRKDFIPATKISLEDDITASVVASSSAIKSLPPEWTAPSSKFVHNCEYGFFRRPDDAIIHRYDKQAEADLSSDGNFLNNYEPLDAEHGKNKIDNTIRFSQYTQPVQNMVIHFVERLHSDYYSTPAYPRIVDGKPTKNPRYLQVHPNIKYRRSLYLADLSSRLYRRQDSQSPLLRPITSVLPGRRNNPAEPDAGVSPMCMSSPIDHMKLPELFIEYIALITGKSPSTTEGALTKGPFNTLLPIYDMNNALVSHLATEQPTFITAVPTLVQTIVSITTSAYSYQRSGALCAQRRPTHNGCLSTITQRKSKTLNTTVKQ